MSQILQAARIVTTLNEMQQTLEVIQDQLREMRMTGADRGLIQDAINNLDNCAPELAHAFGQVLGHTKLREALDAMQMCELDAVC